MFRKEMGKKLKEGQNGPFWDILQPLGPPGPIIRLEGEATSLPRHAGRQASPPILL